MKLSRRSSSCRVISLSKVTKTALLLLLLLFVVATVAEEPIEQTKEEENACSEGTSCLANDAEQSGDNGESTSKEEETTKPNLSSSSSSSSSSQITHQGFLRPEDLPGPVIFDSFQKNSTVQLPEVGTLINYADGSVTQINDLDRGHGRKVASIAADFSLIQQALSKDTIDSMLTLLQSYTKYDEDPDSVDGMPSYEMFLDSPNLDSHKPTIKVRDSDPEALRERNPLREELRNLTRPYLDNVLTPFVRWRYPDICNRVEEGRTCTPCYSLVRRYRHGERQSHATHQDGHALVTVVVSLSDYGKDYTGGLYVSTGFGEREFLALRKGDAAVHRSNLLHGVQVLDLDDRPQDTERWSWIVWYKDSETCDDHSHEWFKDCSDDGDAICQSLHASTVGNTPNLSRERVSQLVLQLNMEAAGGGSGLSAVKIARAYLHKLPSSLPYNEKEAARYYRMAIQSHNPDGHYGMAILYVTSVAKAQAEGKFSKESLSSSSSSSFKELYLEPLAKAVQHLEAAAQLGHTFSMFNLGMAHVFGYGTPQVDMALGAEWFVKSGLPEGYFVASEYAKSVADEAKQRLYRERALALGYGKTWRKQARETTGSGGAAGVDLNLPWPISPHGKQPPTF